MDSIYGTIGDLATMVEEQYDDFSYRNPDFNIMAGCLYLVMANVGIMVTILVSYIVIKLTWLTVAAGVRRFRSDFSARGKMLFSPVFQFEKLMKGSELSNHVKPPSFLARVSVISGGTYKENVGVAVRMEGFLVFLSHVVRGAEVVKITTENSSYTLPHTTFTELYTDVSAFQVTEQVFSRLGMAKPRIGAVGSMGSAGIFVTAHNGEESSMGTLGTTKMAPGMLSYSGSTVPGFSGGPYYVGNVLYGVHSGSMHGNFGWDASFIKALLPTFESSEDWDNLLKRIQEKDRKIQVVRHPAEPSELLVTISGRWRSVGRGDVPDEVLDQLYDAVEPFKEHQLMFESADYSDQACARCGVLEAELAASKAERDDLKSSLKTALDRIKVVEELRMRDKRVATEAPVQTLASGQVSELHDLRVALREEMSASRSLSERLSALEEKQGEVKGAPAEAGALLRPAPVPRDLSASVSSQNGTRPKQPASEVSTETSETMAGPELTHVLKRDPTRFTCVIPKSLRSLPKQDRKSRRSSLAFSICERLQTPSILEVLPDSIKEQMVLMEYLKDV